MTDRLHADRAADPGTGDGEFPFAGLLDREELAFLGRYVIWREFTEGERLWNEGDRDDHLALIVRGRVKLVKETAMPGHALVLGLFGPGTLAGDVSFATGSPRRTSAEAIQDGTAVLLSREGYEQLLVERPLLANQVLGEVLRRVADQLEHANRRLAAIF